MSACSGAHSATGEGAHDVGGGGSPGTGGSGVSHTAGVGGSAGSPSSCGLHKAFGPALSVTTIGPTGGATYDGPAVVERSVSSELVLAFGPANVAQNGSALDADAGASDELPMHARLKLDAMPVLPVGAKVWLTKTPAGDQSSPFYVESPWSIAVRTSADGRLLFGAALYPSSDVPSPIALGDVTETCTDTNYSGECVEHGTVHYSRVDVHGDQVVSIEDGETKPVKVGGFDYDVSISAQRSEPGNTSCADFIPPNGIAVFLIARDLDSLVASLAIGPKPACALGSVGEIHGGLSLFDVNVDTTYDGPVVYRMRSADRPVCFMFDVTGLMSAPNDPVAPSLQVCPDPGMFAEPTPGQQFWASIPTFGITALRATQHGPLLLGFATAGAPFDTATAAMIEKTLGIAVTAQPNCAYAAAENGAPLADNGVLSLWDVVFATTPKIHVGAYSEATIQIGGQDYKVTSSGVVGHEVSFAVYRP